MIDSRSIATRFQLSGTLNEADLEMYRRKLPLTPEARIDGTFNVEKGRKYSPKGLLPGNYSFWSTPERNEWNKGRVFWRSGGVGVFEYEDKHIIDYEMFNISTFFASESIEMRPGGGQVPIGFMSDSEREKNVNRIFSEKVFMKVICQIESSKFEDFWPVIFKAISKEEFMGSFTDILPTSAFTEFERRLSTGESLA